MRIQSKIFALLILIASGCSKSVSDMADDSIRISMPCETKVYMKGLKTYWDKGDEVTVFYRSQTAEQWIFKGKSGDVSGEIACPAVSRKETLEDIFVLYPYDRNATLDGSTLCTAIPSEQQFRKNSYGTALMASRSSMNVVSLQYCTAIMELKYRGPAEVSHIVLSGNNKEKISGESHISFIAGEPQLICNGASSVTLLCNSSISSSTTESFYFSIAPGTFNNGVSFTVHFKDGSEQEIMASQEISIKAGHIHTIEAGSVNMPFAQKIINLKFSDGKAKNNPFTKAISFKYDQEIGPYYYDLDGELHPFYFLCQEDTMGEAKTFRQTNGGGLYIGGTSGDYITLPGIKNYKLHNISVSLHKEAQFYIARTDHPETIVENSYCNVPESGEYRMLNLSGTETGVSYRLVLENNTCFRSITLYYRK